MAARGAAPKPTTNRAAKPTLSFPEQNEPEWFHFTIDGVEYVLPSIHTNLSFGAKLAGSASRTRADQLATYIMFEADPVTREAIDRLRGSQGDELATAWVEFEGATVPE